ncbi:MAG: class I SAM-dependent rRNA methyltransferase [Gammaproteobacteria bacterium]|nr:class I SAM-dependent rRNA methyltransferase [Gammaproteobacteria bacterium]
MSTPKTLAPLRLKKKEERRLHTGHLWVFSNEVDVAHTPLTGFEPGQLVSIEASNGAVLGTGYANPYSLICARLVSRDPHYVLDQSLLVHRLNIALSLRERLFDKPYYRLVFGEGDALPGLVVDRYGDVLVVQLTTAGMERVKIEVVAALQKVIKPRAIVLRNDTSSRALEGLPKYVETVLGETPEWVRLEENGVVFEVPVLTGQKTGWFYDHRMNRARMRHYVKDRRVLDVFSYLGGWGVQAAAAGASEVLCVDSSQTALDQLSHNAMLNNVAERVTGMQADAFDALKSLRAERQKFDVVILDPPAFIKRKKDLKQGLQAYHQLNQMAMQVLPKDGILISASCSHHLEPNALQDVLLQTSRHVDRSLQILEQGQQGPDHPIHPAIPETRYLKAFFTRIYLG